MAELIPSWLSWTEEDLKAAEREENFYIYTSGIRDIQAREKSFKDRAAIITKPITIEGNIVSVQLNATQEIPENCDIEYYVSFLESPSINDWMPILPIGQTQIQSEKLFIDTSNGKSLRLRFTPEAGSIIVKENEDLVDKSLWSYSSGENNISIKYKINPLNIYTVSYKPTNKNKIVVAEKYKNITDYSESGVLGENFPNGADMQGSIFLSKTPYIDRKLTNSSDYSPVQVNLYGSMLVSNGGSIFSATNPTIPILDFSQGQPSTPIMMNKTNYNKNEDPPLTPYNPKWDLTLNDGNGAMTYPVFEYLHKGRQLIFTEPFNNFNIYSDDNIVHGNGRLVVYYKYINLTFRMKIIMRNLSRYESSLTPIIRDYSLVFEAEK